MKLNSEDEIRLSVKHLKAEKKPGPDSIIPEFFMYGGETLLPILIKLFNRLFKNGEYPDNWTESIIVTLHKKGDVNNVENYRGTVTRITKLNLFPVPVRYR